MVRWLIAVNGLVSAFRQPEKRIEIFIELAHRLLLSAEKLRQTVSVVRNGPRRGLRRLFAIVAIRLRQLRTRHKETIRFAREEASFLLTPVVPVIEGSGAEHLRLFMTADGIGENRRRTVCHAEILRPRNRFTRYVARHIAARHVRMETSARFRHPAEHSAITPIAYRVDVLRTCGVALYSRIGLLEIESAKALHIRFSEHNLGWRTAHDSRIGRIRPFRQPSALSLHVYERLHHSIHIFRCNQRKKRMLRTIRIPQREAGVHLAFVNLVVKCGIVASEFINLAREKKRTV